VSVRPGSVANVNRWGHRPRRSYHPRGTTDMPSTDPMNASPGAPIRLRGPGRDRRRRARCGPAGPGRPAPGRPRRKGHAITWRCARRSPLTRSGPSDSPEPMRGKACALNGPRPHPRIGQESRIFIVDKCDWVGNVIGAADVVGSSDRESLISWSAPRDYVQVVALTSDQLDTLKARVVEKLGDPRQLKELDLSNKGLALCVIDSIQSTGVRYRGVENVLVRYVKFRKLQGADPYTDGMPELLMTFDELGGPGPWAAEIGNQHKTSTSKGAPLKAVAVQAEAATLAGLGVMTRDDLRRVAADRDRLREVGAAWKAVKAQSSGITWRYVLMLAGVPGVKPDRMIVRFVADALGMRRQTINANFAEDAVIETAAALGINNVTTLDHAIWLYQRGRPLN